MSSVGDVSGPDRGVLGCPRPDLLHPVVAPLRGQGDCPDTRGDTVNKAASETGPGVDSGDIVSIDVRDICI